MPDAAIQQPVHRHWNVRVGQFQKTRFNGSFGHQFGHFASQALELGQSRRITGAMPYQ
jgi:hypothetical protein